MSTATIPLPCPDLLPPLRQSGYRVRVPATQLRESNRPFGWISVRRLQIALGTAWLLDGLLQLQPAMFSQGFVSGVLEPSAQGQPGWLAWLINTNAHVVGTHVAAWNALFAGVQLLIGLGLLYRPTLKPALALSFGWSAGVWVLGEGCGMLLTGNASALTGAPGAVLLYGLIGLMLWPVDDSPNRMWSHLTQRPRWVARPSRGSSAAAGSTLGELGGRVIWAGLWSCSAVLWLLPANSAQGAVGKAVSGMANGEPVWLGHMLESAGNALSSYGPGLSVLMAAASLVIGFGPLMVRKTTPFLLAGAALALVFWVVGQAFGGILTGPLHGTATDPNCGPLVVLMAATLLPGVRAAASTSSISEQRATVGLASP